MQRESCVLAGIAHVVKPAASKKLFEKLGDEASRSNTHTHPGRQLQGPELRLLRVTFT
jgi:hypothetical protein